MPQTHIFADEAGDFKFERKVGASKYFILTTVRMDECDVGDELLDLRRSMVRRGIPIGDKFHASSDLQAVRDEVFAVIGKHDLRVDSTILEKSKSQAHCRVDEPTFYKYAWYYHAKYIVPRQKHKDVDVLLCAAALETKTGKAAFKSAFNEAIQQATINNRWTTEFRPSVADPCLWVADYCGWAVQRKWEMEDLRSHKLINSMIRSEFDLWRTGKVHHY